MKLNEKVLQRSLPFLASILAGKGVRLERGGSDSATDGTTTWLRDFPQDSPWYQLSVGTLFHENAGHMRHTDWSAVSDAVANSSPLRKEMLNAIEDPRIERAAARDFPGGLRPIAEVIAHYAAEGRFNAPTADIHPAALLQQYSILKMRSALPHQDFLAEEAKKAAEAVEAVMGKGTLIKLNGLLAQAPTLTSTRDALDLTDAVLTMLKEEKEKQEEEQQQGPSNDEKDQNQDDANGAGQGDDPDGQSQDNTRQDQGGNAGGPSPGDIAKALAEALGAGADDVGGFDPFEQAKKELTKAAGNGAADQGLPSLPQAVDIDGISGAGTGGAEAILSQANKTAGRLRTQLQGLVEASCQDDFEYRQHGPRIDPRAVRRLKIGDPKVFLRVDDKQAPNTVVHLLVDRSGSMAKLVPTANGESRRMVDIAVEAALSLSMALEGIPGVNVGVTAFPGPDTNDGTQVVKLQKHGEPARRAARRFRINAGGGTPMAEALLHAAFAVLQEREERKIVIVVTDGDPNYRRSVEDLVKKCTASGVETIGIGIGTNAVQGLFPTAVTIGDVTDLRGALFGLVRKSLMAA